MALDKIDEEMDKVTDHGVGLVAVAKAVKSLNLTLAHHTAWTEERFEAVDRRFDAIDKSSTRSTCGSTSWIARSTQGTR